ncbi:MAG TPA: hypothetical protein VHR47_01595 [Bacillota bacterium]|nr:hypothetical protein [Bacillota bacterium]
MSIITLREADLDFDPTRATSEDLANLETLYQRSSALASQHLTGLIGTNFSIQLSSLETQPFTSIIDAVHHDQRFQTGIHSRVTGDLRGELYLFFSKSSAHRLVQIGFKRKGFGSLFLNRLEESFLNEFANIFFNAFWQGFNEKIAIRWWLTPPKTLNRPGYALSLANRIYARERLAFLADLDLVETKTGSILIYLPAEDSIDAFLRYLH